MEQINNRSENKIPNILQNIMGISYRNSQYWSNHRVLSTASLFCFGQFVFKVIFSFTVSVFFYSITKLPVQW